MRMLGPACLTEGKEGEGERERKAADGYKYLRPVGAEDVPFAEMARYQRAIGELNWLVRGTRPDLAFVAHKLSQHCHKPCVWHWKGVQQVFRYLKFSQGFTLCYGQDCEELLGYSDADFASDTSDRRFTMGYTYLLGGAAVTWASRKQQTISYSLEVRACQATTRRWAWCAPETLRQERRTLLPAFSLPP
jgi:hypothetical protein